MSAIGNYEVVSGSVSVASSSTTTVNAPTGKVVFSLSPTNGQFPLTRMYPSPDGLSWVVDNSANAFAVNVAYRLVVAEMGC